LLIISFLILHGIIFAANSKRIIINEFLTSNSTGLRDADGDYSDWIELYNPGSEVVNLTGWSLTDSNINLSEWVFPDVTIRAGEYLVVFASGKNKVASNNELHTNFSLSKDGEYLAIVEPGGTISDEYTPTFPLQQPDVSFGYYQGQQVFFEIPSPGAVNTMDTKAQVPVFSKSRGFYDNSFYVSLSVANSDTKIYYTTDGTRPTAQSTLYTSPVRIEKTTPLSAVGIKGSISSPVVSNTYFFIKDIVNQPNNPVGYPDRWGYLGADIKYNDYAAGDRAPADYAMDPNVCNNALYKNSINDAFLSIPSVSIVTNPGYLFSDSVDDNIGGIYIHTGVTTGAGWERPVSIEYYEPSSGKQFQINCGLKLHGAASRQPEKTGKHSFMAAFRGIYGETKLKFNLFEDTTAVDKFDFLVLRAGYNQSWLHPDSWQRTNSQYTNDSFAKRIQHDMGHPGSHDRFVHLFINGLYWGLYDISERLDENFMDAYFKGDAEDFDIINHDGLSEGDITAYNRLLELAKAANYDQLVSENLLNINSFIDYMLLNFYIGNMDWATNNWYIARNRINPESGFRCFSWDAESSLTDVNLNRINGSNGFQGKFRSILFGSSSGTSTDGGLYNNPEFRLLFADRVNKHFFNGGSLTPNKTVEFFNSLAKEIDLPVILESARWGDYRKNTLTPKSSLPALYTRNDHWVPRRDKLLKDYFPKRTDIVYNQLKELGLVSEIEPPVFSSYGGQINSSIQLTMTAPQTIYYTLNGLDPREAGSGNTASFAVKYTSALQINGDCTVKARAKQGSVWSALTEATFTRENLSSTPMVNNDILKVYFRDNAINCELGRSGNSLLEIYSVDGKCLQRTQTYCQPGNNRFELSVMPSGVYLCKITVEGSVSVYKFIK
jgi:hypothetical protein